MFYLFSTFLFLAIHTILVFSRHINVYPELFYYPWLVAKGLIPYRDFFDHHGFLLYYLLAPFSLVKSTSALQFVYIVIQTANLLLVLLILKKIGSKLAFFLCGGLYLVLTYYLSGNSFWYENVTCLIYLVIYYVLTLKKIPHRYVMLGVLAALASFIKPNAAIILLPVIVETKNIRVLIWFAVLWILVLTYFFINHGLFQLFNNLFIVNFYVAKTVREQNNFFIEKGFYDFSFFIFGISTILLILNKRVSKNILILLFLLISFTFILNGAQNIYMFPAAAFFIIYLGNVLKNIKVSHRIILAVILCIYAVFLLRKDKHQFVFYNNPPYIQNKISLDIVEELKKIPIDKKQLYVFGNQEEIYYLLDKIPSTYFTVNYPFISKYLRVEDRILSDIRTKKVEYVVIPKPFDIYYVQFNSLRQYIVNNYEMKKSNDEFDLYFLKDNN